MLSSEKARDSNIYTPYIHIIPVFVSQDFTEQ